MIYKFLKKYKSLSLTLKATLWFTICNFALKGISFICMPLYTRLLPTEEYGRLTVLTSYETIFTIFATFELYLGAHQRGILKYKKDLNTFEQTIVLSSNLLTILVFVLVRIFIKPFYQFTGVSLTIYFLMSIYFLGYAPYNCWLNKKRFDYDYKAAVSVTITIAILTNIFPILTIKIFNNTAFVKIASTLIISSIVYFPFWFLYFKPKNIINNWSNVKEYLLFSLKFQGPLVFHSLSYYILNQSDRIMIEKFSDSSKVAFYSVAYSFATVIILVQNSFNQVLKSWRYKALENKRYNDMKKLSNLVIALVGTGIILFMLIAPEVFKILFPKKYFEAIICMPPITISVFFLFLYTIFVDIESYYGKTSYIAYVSTFCAILNILLNYLGMKIFSYVICAYTTLFCYIIMSFLYYIFMKKTCRDFNINTIPVDSKFIWKFSCVLLFIFIIVKIVYGNLLIRYSILILILIIIFIKREYIKNIFIEYKILE